MEDLRFHLTVRVRGQSVCDSYEFRTEDYDSPEDLYLAIVEWADDRTIELREGNDED